PRDPSLLLLRHDLARGRRPPAADPRGNRHLDAERALHDRRDGPSRGDDARVAAAPAAAPMAGDRHARRPDPEPPGPPRPAPSVASDARLDAHHRPLPRPRISDLHGSRPRRGGRPLHGHRPPADAGPVSEAEAAAPLHRRALRLPPARGAPRRAPRDRARRDDLPLPDPRPEPRADRPEGGGCESLSREPPD